MVRICAHGYPSAAALGDFQQAQIQILSVGISIDLHRFIEPPRFAKDRFPICAQTETIIVNPAARMAEDLNVGIANGGEITFGLVFLAPQGGMERAEDKIERAQRLWIHIAFA